MLFEILGIGTDIENVSRFDNISYEKNPNFLKKIFTEKELKYCFSKRKASEHLAVRFAGKEAVIKAINSLGKIHNINYNEIEIKNNESGLPLVNIFKNGYEGLSVYLTLSHSEDNAIAFVIIVK